MCIWWHKTSWRKVIAVIDRAMVCKSARIKSMHTEILLISYGSQAAPSFVAIVKVQQEDSGNRIPGKECALAPTK